MTRTGIRDALQRHVSANDIQAALQELLARRPAVITQTEECTGGDREQFIARFLRTARKAR